MTTMTERVYWGCTTDGCEYGHGIAMAKKWKFCPICGVALAEITERKPVTSWATG